MELVRAQDPRGGRYGAQVTGGGAGGTVSVLGTQGPQAEATFQRVVARFRQETGYDPCVFEGSWPGTDRLGVVVVTL